MNDLQKKLTDAIKYYLKQGLEPREAIPKALTYIGHKLSPGALEYLIQVHEKEVDRLKGLQIKTGQEKIQVESPNLIVVVKDGGSYATALKQIKSENK